MGFVKNIQFSRHTKAPDRLKEFNFRKQPGIQESIYQIDVSDELGKRHLFSMQLLDGQWKIRETLVAVWILAAEPLLQAAIEDQESPN